MIPYVKSLFLDIDIKENETKRNYFTSFCLLFFLNLFSIKGSLITLFYRTLIGQKGPERLTGFTVLNSINSSFFTDVPWDFMLLIGCFLLVRKYYVQFPKIAWFFISIFVYGFFKALTVLPYYFIPSILQKSDEVMTIIETDILIYKVLYISIAVIGFLFLIYPFFVLKKKKNVKSHQINRENFIHKLFYLYTLPILLAPIMISFTVILKTYGFNTTIIPLIIALTLITFFFYYVSKRLKNAGKPFIFILIYPLLYILVLIAAGFIWKTTSVFIMQSSSFIIQVCITLSSLFLLLCMLLPEKLDNVSS